MRRTRIAEATKPRVSVLMPVFNAERHLPRAIGSIMRQRFRDWELIAVDDGSTDATATLLRHYAAADDRIRPLFTRHLGIVGALNDGLEQCRGAYIARMDSDDVSHPDRLAAQVDYLDSHAGTDVVSCLVRKFPRRLLRCGMLRYEQWLNALCSNEQMAADMYVESPLAHPSVLLRREALNGGYRDMGWAEDYDLWLRLHQEGRQFAKLDRLLFFWFDREDRHSRTSFRYAPDSFRRCKAWFLKQGPLRHHRQVVLWGAGRIGKRMGMALQAQGFGIAAFVDLDPRKIGHVIHGAPVVHPSQVHAFHGVPILSAVGKAGVRETIRGDLRQMGLAEGRDFWCVA